MPKQPPHPELFPVRIDAAAAYGDVAQFENDLRVALMKSGVPQTVDTPLKGQFSVKEGHHCDLMVNAEQYWKLLRHLPTEPVAMSIAIHPITLALPARKRGDAMIAIQYARQKAGIDPVHLKSDARLGVVTIHCNSPQQWQDMQHYLADIEPPLTQRSVQTVAARG